MRVSASWYEAHSYCADSVQRHHPAPIVGLDGALHGHLCEHCLERVRQVMRGSSLWIAEAEVLRHA